MTSALRVLYAIDSLAAGGAERSLAHLAACYPGLGIELEIAYLHDRPGVQPDLVEAGARLFPAVGSNRWERIARLTDLVRSRRPHLVHTTLFEADIAGRIAARRAHVPVVSSLVNVAYGEEHRADPNVGRWRLRGAQLVDAVTGRLAVRMHAVSVFVADTMARRLRYPRERIVVIPRGRDAHRLGRRTRERRAALRSALGIDGTVPVALAVARQEHQKGLDVLLDATARVLGRFPDLRVLVAGREGTQSHELRKRSRALGLESRVEFLGARDDVAELLCAADLFVLPSRREGLPGSVLEAMALETPIIASDLPQVRELIDDSMGVIVPRDGPEQLAAAVIDVLTHAREAQERATRARDRFMAEFTIEEIADRTATFYREILAIVA